MASRPHFRPRTHRRHQSRNSPVLDLRSRLESRYESRGGEGELGHMDNLQMTVLNLDGDDDFGPRFRHVPELEEEESTLRQPRSSEQSNYEVSDLREKLHTSHNTGACNDGTRRIRQRHHGLEIQIEADNPEDYQDRRILSYEESVEYRERGRALSDEATFST